MKIHFITLGCKVNQYETQAMERLLADAGQEIVDSPVGADAVVVNTCAVTAESARKSRQAARRAKKLSGDAVLVVCGCASQADEAAARALGADYVGGAGERRAVVEFLLGLAGSSARGRVAAGGEAGCGVSINDEARAAACAERGAAAPCGAGDVERAAGESVGSVGVPRERRVIEPLPAGAFDAHTRAYLKVQDGCGNFCAYCIIPYLRGPVRSLPVEDAAKEAKSLAQQGFREIVLTGIEVSSYGEDIGSDFATLVEAVAGAARPARIRLGSIEPSRFDEETVARLAAIDTLCPHFHLSLQNGSAGVLKRMRRKYTPDEYAAVAARLREKFDDPALTTDLIVGFPGETEEEFEESLAFLRRIGFAAVHVFPYSKREGTLAARLDGHLQNAEKQRRAALAAAVAAECRDAYLARRVGRVLNVLFEYDTRGHSENYLDVEARGERGALLPVRITAVGADGMLLGEVVE